MHLYMGLKKEKKIGFNGGIGAWGWSVSRGKRASEWGWNPRGAEPCVENVCYANVMLGQCMLLVIVSDMVN